MPADTHIVVTLECLCLVALPVVDGRDVGEDGRVRGGQTIGLAVEFDGLGSVLHALVSNSVLLGEGRHSHGGQLADDLHIVQEDVVQFVETVECLLDLLLSPADQPHIVQGLHTGGVVAQGLPVLGVGLVQISPQEGHVAGIDQCIGIVVIQRKGLVSKVLGIGQGVSSLLKKER